MSAKKISEGAESYIYSGWFLGLDCVLKRRIEKRYRLKEIDDELRIRRTKTEARIMSLVSSIGVNSPKVLLVDRYDIYMSRIPGARLSNILQSSALKKDMGRIFSVLGEYAAILHAKDVVHGDLTPANAMVDKDLNVYLIDFGLSDFTNSIEQKALDILLMKRSVDDGLFGAFIQSYRKHSNSGEQVIRRMGEIERRGRYNTRTILT